MKKIISMAVAATLTITALVGCSNSSPSEPTENQTEIETEQTTSGEKVQKEVKEKPLVGLSFKTLQEQRWAEELELVTETLEGLGAEVIYQIADNEVQKQIDQIQNLVTQGIDILMVLPVDSGTLDKTLRDVHDAGVLVINYEENNGSIYFDMCGGLSNINVGRSMTKPIADALKEKGGNVGIIGGSTSGSPIVLDFKAGMKESFEETACTIIGDQDIEKYDASQAQAVAENWITQYGDDLAAICPMNDGMAGGVVKALEAAGLEGKVMVCGQDADLTACQRIADGTQYCTVYKNSRDAAIKVCECAIKLYRGELTEEDFGGTFVKNSNGEDVPFASVEPVIVTKENLDQVMIDSGIYTHEQIYEK